MLNKKIIGLFVLGLALSGPLQNANAMPSPGGSDGGSSSSCYKPSGTCKSGYTLSADGKSCVAASDPCEPDNYEDFVAALGNSACTTVTLANDIDATDKAVTTLRMLDNQTLDGNGKTLMLNSTITLGGSSNIKNLTLISEASDALDISQGGNLLSDINVQSTGNALKMNAPYMMSGYNTLTAYGSNAVGLYSSTFGVLTLFSDASLDINASGGATGVQLANNSEIIVEEGATLDINVMDGYAIADIEGLLNIDGTLNIDHDGPQSPIYGASSTLTIEGDGDINIVTNSGSDTINIANLMVYLDGTLNIEAPIANGAYFINSSNGSFNFYSGSSKLITKSTGSRTLSDTDAGINIMVHELSSNAIWQVTGSGYNTTWRVNGNDLNCLYGYNKSYPTGSCWVSILSTDPS